MVDGVTKIYGVRPSIDYVKLAALVENRRRLRTVNALLSSD
jgi:hypothetical protein